MRSGITYGTKEGLDLVAKVWGRNFDLRVCHEMSLALPPGLGSNPFQDEPPRRLSPLLGHGGIGGS